MKPTIHTVVCDALRRPSTGSAFLSCSTPPTKLPPNETTTPTLNPLRVDRAPVRRGSGLPGVALGAWGLGAVTPITGNAGDARPSGL